MQSFSTLMEPLETRRLLSTALLPTANNPPATAPALTAPLAATAAPTPTNGGVTLTETATQQFTAKIGEFTYKTIDQSLVANITWGDGTHSTGKLVGSYATGEYYVQGTHTYAKPGTYTVDVKIIAHILGSPTGPSGQAAEFTSIITAKPLVPTKGGVTLTELATQSFTAKIGEFTYKTVDQALIANITWGDGTHSTGKLVGSYATGEYYVQGTHTYAKPGTYKVDVKILAHLVGSPNSPTGEVAAFTSVITAIPLVPTKGGVTLTKEATDSFTANIGEFQYKTVDQALDAIIYWGDGTHSTGKLVGSYATGKYYVQGTRTYSHTGTYKVDVKIFTHPLGSPILPTTPVAQFTSVIQVIPDA